MLIPRQFIRSISKSLLRHGLPRSKYKQELVYVTLHKTFLPCFTRFSNKRQITHFEAMPLVQEGFWGPFSSSYHSKSYMPQNKEMIRRCAYYWYWKMPHFAILTSGLLLLQTVIFLSYKWTFRNPKLFLCTRHESNTYKDVSKSCKRFIWIHALAYSHQMLYTHQNDAT